MTWHSPFGDLTLKGEEAKLFRDVILDFCRRIAEAGTDQDSAYGGATIFDQMTRTQQLASLEEVARHLFFTTAECAELVAWSEATLAAILFEIRSLLEYEIELSEDDRVRRLLLQLTESEFDNDEHWDNCDEWSFVFDCYQDRFLWDLDFEDTSMLDLPPERAKAIKEGLGILDEYHSTPPPDLDNQCSISEFPDRLRLLIDGKKKSS